LFSTAGPEEISNFGFSYFRTGRDVNDNAHSVIEQVFKPMARELRRYLEQEVSKVPAADRVVRLDHNSAPYRDAIDALEKLEKVLREANDYPDGEDKDQRIAEVSATRRLLQSVRVRVTAVVAVIGSGLTYLATHFVGTAIDTASHSVIEQLTALFGAYF
jgi:histidinol-phosphate/aromatic aminotransferase/cobyric acid decarboxylase-like protein